jgi:hypothetical protein
MNTIWVIGSPAHYEQVSNDGQEDDESEDKNIYEYLLDCTYASDYIKVARSSNRLRN